MKVRKTRRYSTYTYEAGQLLGQLIQLARKEKQWSEQELSERAGISIPTLRKIEKGDLTIALGFAFELAAILGIQLFDAGPARLAEHLEGIKNKIAVLPKRVRASQKQKVHDDF